MSSSSKLPIVSTTTGLGVSPSADGRIACTFCGLGDVGERKQIETSDGAAPSVLPGEATVHLSIRGIDLRMNATVGDAGIEIATSVPLTTSGGRLSARVVQGTSTADVVLEETGRDNGPTGAIRAQRFSFASAGGRVERGELSCSGPTRGCARLVSSTGERPAAVPLQLAPSRKAEVGRETIDYVDAIEHAGALVAEQLRCGGRIAAYASAQLDVFGLLAMQEVFRLLGVRALSSSSELSSEAEARATELLTGRATPALSLADALEGAGRTYFLLGWNGYISHPPVLQKILERDDRDVYLVDTVVSETALAVAQAFGPERVLLIKPGADTELALSIAHEVVARHADALSDAIDPDSRDALVALAKEHRFAATRVAARIAAEPQYEERIARGIRAMAYTLAQSDAVPITIASMGLSQVGGAVPHATWGSLLGLVGKWGRDEQGSVLGGPLRVPGQAGSEAATIGLAPDSFFGRLPMDRAADAAERMGLPRDAYDAVTHAEPRSFFDASDEPELLFVFGAKLDASLPDREALLARLKRPQTKLVVIDPRPDDVALELADLVVPPPHHSAATRLLLSGEHRWTLSRPQHVAPAQTRSDATFIYDLMRDVAGRSETDDALRSAAPWLASLADAGTLRRRFDDELPREDGEVSRRVLWERVLAHGELADHEGKPIAFDSLLEAPVRGELRRPDVFRCFTPSSEDLVRPEGLVLNTGRSPMRDEREAIAWALQTHNNGKSTPSVGMPSHNPVVLSPSLARRIGVADGDVVRITSRGTGHALSAQAKLSDRIKGDTLYMSRHPSATAERINQVTRSAARCRLSGTILIKGDAVRIERAQDRVSPENRARSLGTTRLDVHDDLPIWDGQNTPLYLIEKIEETHDVVTYRFQGDPLCRFVYHPGQFCSFVLNIDGKKVVRSYTISSSPTRPYALEVTIKRVEGGLVSNWLADNLEIGDRVEISGPRGRFCLTPGKVPRKLLLLGAGSGITPVMSMARWLVDLSGEVDAALVNCVRTPDDIVFRDELRHLVRCGVLRDAHVVPSRADDSWTGPTGRVCPELLQTLVPDYAEREIYMCGPAGFMAAVTDFLRADGFDLGHLHTESFGGVRTSAVDKPRPLPAPEPEPVTPAPAPAPVVPIAAEPIPSRPSATPLPSNGALAVHFAASNRTAKATGAYILDLAEDNGLELNYACRAGSCGECKVTLLEGEVEMDYEDGLTEDDKKQRKILPCVAKARTDCTLDA